MGARARTAQGLYQQSQTGYKQVLANKNLHLWYPEYLKQTDIEGIIGGFSYESQGLDPQRFGGTKYRWGMRAG